MMGKQFLREIDYTFTLQKEDTCTEWNCLVKHFNISHIFEINLALKVCLYLFGKLLSVSLDNFIKHKPDISEDYCTTTYLC